MKETTTDRHTSLERLLAVAQELANVIGPAALAHALNQSEQTVTNWGSRGVSKLGAMKAQEIFGCSATWVLNGAGPKLITGASLNAVSNVSAALLGGVRIPVINYVQAGVWSSVIDGGDAEEWLTTDQQLSRSAFALEIKGDSMLPEFKPGDRVIIDPEVSPLPGDFVVAKNCEEEATFKKYRPRGTNAEGTPVFELVPLNDDFATIRSSETTIRIVGTMVEHRKYRRAR